MKEGLKVRPSPRESRLTGKKKKKKKEKKKKGSEHQVNGAKFK